MISISITLILLYVKIDLKRFIITYAIVSFKQILTYKHSLGSPRTLKKNVFHFNFGFYDKKHIFL